MAKQQLDRYRRLATDYSMEIERSEFSAAITAEKTCSLVDKFRRSGLVTVDPYR